MSTENKAKRSSFTGTLGFIMAAAGSAVGLGNIWRFPYLAAKDNGGVFILVYVILAVTFGFTLLTTEIAIGRKTAQSPLTAYGLIHPKGRTGVPCACNNPALLLHHRGLGGKISDGLCYGKGRRGSGGRLFYGVYHSKCFSRDLYGSISWTDSVRGFFGSEQGDRKVQQGTYACAACTYCGYLRLQPYLEIHR